MSETAQPSGQVGEVISLRAVDTQTEVALAEATPPAYLDTTGLDAGKRRDVIPERWQRHNIRGTLDGIAGLWWHRVKYHGVRSHIHTGSFIWYALRGAARLVRLLAAWWGWREGWILESQAVAAGRPGHHEAMQAHTQGLKTRAQRGKVTGVCAAFTTAGVLAMVVWAPWWGWALLAAAVFGVLVHAGRPRGKPLITAAVVPPKYAPPTPEIITRALGSLGIAQINQAVKDGHGIQFVSDVHRDGPGWGVQLDLPHGVTAEMILAKRPQLASGLRRPLSATWPAPVPHEHEGRLDLWIGFHDISKARPPVWPLLRAGQADVFGEIPFGTDPRGRNVPAGLFELNWLTGAAPGQGKTSTLRVLDCAAALDPVCDLWIHEHSGKGDLEPLAKVCHRYVSGLDDDAVAYTAASLRMLRAELARRSAQLKKIPKEARPDGKVTRELAGKRSLGLRPIVCTIDECQNVFMHPQYGAQAADDAGYVIRVGRAYGLILILATQRPDKDSLPTQVGGNVTARFCLHVPGQVENDLILGTSSYQNGYRATSLRPKADAGVGWLKAEGKPQIVRTYYLDLNDTERVAARARVIRERAGVLTGYALGEATSAEARSFAADVLSVFGPDAKLYAATIAARLAESIPDAYADITQDAVASQLRALGVEIKNVREAGQAPRKGCDRAAVEAATAAAVASDA
jgi:S-DNA-T family DNA segregation ATPase FtsK/SpoIIIE